MVGRKYSPGLPRSPGFLLSVRTLRQRTPEVGEVVYSQAENKTNISTSLKAAEINKSSASNVNKTNGSVKAL